jgi:hypothetical protein
MGESNKLVTPKPMILKLAIPIIIALASFGAGMVTHARVQKPVQFPEYKCPACNCPAAVELQHFDVEKLKNNRGNFTYSPQISGVTISGTDSTFFREMIRQGVEEGFNNVVKAKKIKLR